MIVFTKVRLPFGWLGNMSAHPVDYNGLTWRTTEHLFQAMRFDVDSTIRDQIRAERSPMGAKMMAKKHASSMVIMPRSAEDLDQMRICLLLKVQQHEDLLRQLLNTGDETLVEDCSNRANESGLFWGMAKQPDGSWLGQNMLGKLWAETRTRMVVDSLTI